MRRTVTAAIVAILLIGLLPLSVLAAAPVAEDVDAETDEDVAVTITLSATDPENAPITAFTPGTPTAGSLGSVSAIVCAGGDPNVCTATVRYTPAANASGTVTFGYTATDGIETSAPATVTIEVHPVPEPVDARNDAVKVKATTTATLDLLKSNGSGADIPGEGVSATALTITGVSKPAKGTATITGGGKTVTYDPTGCAVGGDTFTYTLSDGQTTDTATVNVTITRPGQNGASWGPITDVPSYTFLNDSTMTTNVPLRVSWCGVSSQGTTIRNYRLQQRTNGGSWSTLISSTSSTSSTRSLRTSTTYEWRVEANDTAGRNGAYRASPAIRITRYQDSSASIAYGGTWGTATAGSPSDGSQHYTFTADASASLTVTNKQRFAIVGAKSSSRGSFRVYVDNALVATVSAKTSSSTVAYRKVLYHRSLTSGVGVSHTIRIEAVGNGRVDLDAILVLGAP